MDEIVRLLWQRDEQALTMMQQQYGGLCYTILTKFLHTAQDAEEALNDVLLQIWNSIPPAKPKCFRAYLAKAARNIALHYMEKGNALKRRGVTVLLDELSECISDSASENELENAALKMTLDRFVRSLHGDERSFFVRRYFYGQSIKEIASTHNCQENRVAVTLHRIRIKLRERLIKEGYTV